MFSTRAIRQEGVPFPHISQLGQVSITLSIETQPSIMSNPNAPLPQHLFTNTEPLQNLLPLISHSLGTITLLITATSGVISNRHPLILKNELTQKSFQSY